MNAELIQLTRKELIRNGIAMLGDALLALGLVEQNPCSNSGASFKNEVFALHAYSWADYCEQAPEAPQCDYCKSISLLQRDGQANDSDWQADKCSCNGDEPTCDNLDCMECSPNFYHFETGKSASWYKHVNRGFELEQDIEPQLALRIFAECLDSLRK